MVILEIDIKKDAQSVWGVRLISGGEQDEDYEDRLAMAMRDAMLRGLVDIQMPPLPSIVSKERQ